MNIEAPGVVHRLFIHRTRGINRSIITPAYAHNFICDVILGSPSSGVFQLDLFD